VQPNRCVELAECLLITTLSAESSVASGDWETAGQLLRRREQLLTQLEREADIEPAKTILEDVQRAEASLLSLMERSTRDAAEEIGRIATFRKRRNPFARNEQSGTLIERYG